MSSTTGMRGGGFYDAHSSGQRAAMDEFLPWIVEAMADLPLPTSGSPVTLLDLGSSEGATRFMRWPRSSRRCATNAGRHLDLLRRSADQRLQSTLRQPVSRRDAFA